MEEDNTSTEVAEVTEAPESDPILDALSDTEDNGDTANPEVVETPEEQEPETETEPEVEPTEGEVEEVETPTDPKDEARRRYEERQSAIREREERVARVSDEHIKGSEDDQDERIRTLEAKDYGRLVEHNENTLINEFETAKSKPELQIFNPESDEFIQKAYDKAIRDYNAGYVEYDQNQNIIRIKGSLIEHLTEYSGLIQGAVKSGAVQQVKAARKMQTSADSKPAATPKEPVVDNILDILTSD